MREWTLLGFAEFLRSAKLEHDVRHARERALEIIAGIIAAEARRVLGTYDFDWPQLAESTQEDRERKGFPANEPLLRTGELRKSISATILIPGKLAEVGSSSDVAVYQELGTASIPPRPFLTTAAIYCVENPEIRKMIAEIIGAAIESKSVDEEIFRIVSEAFRELAHDLKEDAKELVHEEGGHHGRH